MNTPHPAPSGPAWHRPMTPRATTEPHRTVTDLELAPSAPSARDGLLDVGGVRQEAWPRIRDPAGSRRLFTELREDLPVTVGLRGR